MKESPIRGLKNDLNNLLGDEKDKQIIFLNDADKEYLIRYYNHMIKETSALWRKILQEVLTSRQLEIERFADNEQSELDIELLPLQLEDIKDVVEAARASLRDQVNAVPDAILNRPSNEDLQRVKELLKNLKANRE
ncbi:hypothetical protein [Cohnella fermenti]|uniref:Uncharacterized protein n=1 Tax=Cohnella fermenti TaxID=2565925 RepID=A0A4S4BED4_9BACL|nr:hypothetical protein [Cohnella fermenti]THF72482.1 hypothetical protein E6C55_32970 [Cohnella fermenti]